ncbi:MAG: cyclic nucleotide-binding domain-containing protein [Anaerolineae bacterium]|nr:cyclic nucleotide-binding domain-containing protein [Anaerolineae bacterium]
MKTHSPLIQALFSEETLLLQEVMRTVHLEDGQVLFQRGDPGDALYVIESGTVRIFTVDDNGREITLNNLDAGEAFGELALLDGRPRSASISAIGPVTLHRLSRQDFLERVHRSPALTQSVIQLLSDRARHLTDYIEKLGLWARMVAQQDYTQVINSIEETLSSPDHTLSAVAESVKTMVQAIREREERLRQEAIRLRIQIDHASKERQVSQITETEYFQNLVQQASQLRGQAS